MVDVVMVYVGSFFVWMVSVFLGDAVHWNPK